MTAREELNKIKEHLDIATDFELSEELNVNKRNIESWIKRDKIPDKWRMIIQQKHEKSAKSETKTEDSVSLSVSLLQAGAGEGVYNFESQELLLSLNPRLFPSLAGQDITAIQIDGDSMEPGLRQGDYILITPTKEERHTEDGVYVIRIEGMMKVKSLQFLLDGTIEIISDNPKYRTQLYDPNTSQVDFQIIGKKRLLISR